VHRHVELVVHDVLEELVVHFHVDPVELQFVYQLVDFLVLLLHCVLELGFTVEDVVRPG